MYTAHSYFLAQFFYTEFRILDVLSYCTYHLVDKFVVAVRNLKVTESVIQIPAVFVLYGLTCRDCTCYGTLEDFKGDWFGEESVGAAVYASLLAEFVCRRDL